MEQILHVEHTVKPRNMHYTTLSDAELMRCGRCDAGYRSIFYELGVGVEHNVFGVLTIATGGGMGIYVFVLYRPGSVL